MDTALKRVAYWLGDRFQPFSPDDNPQPPGDVRAFLHWALWEFRGLIVVLAVATLALAAVDVWAAWYIGELIDLAANTDRETFIAEHWGALVIGILGFMILRPAAHILQSGFQTLALVPNLSVRSLWRLHRHTLGQHIGFFQEDFAGRLASKQMQTSGSLAMAVSDAIMSIGLMLTYMIAMCFVLGATDWRLAAATILWAATFAIFIAKILPHIRAASKERAQARAAVNGRFVDSFTNMATVKLFAHAGREEAFAREGLERYRNSSLEFGRIGFVARVGITLLGGVGSAIIIGLALWFWVKGAATIGDVSAAAALIMRATHMSGWVAWSAIGVFENLGTIEDGASTLSPKPKVVDRPDARKLTKVAGAVSFDRATFQYGRDGGGIKDLSLSIGAGERIGLVGQSGAGKSTLVNLLLRLYDVEGGAVCIDGTDIRDLTQTSMRAQIAMVTQDTAMFNRSAYDNIRYGRPTATDAEVREAARRAQALEFVEELRDREGRTGFKAHIGERGVKLSGGQRQRIAIARAILKDAPILILDEATSALDSEVEAEIQAELADLMQGRTVIAIAHRLSTIAHLDRIVVMERGRIVEDGPHGALIESSGAYARFWSRQSGGFLGLDAAE